MSYRNSQTFISTVSCWHNFLSLTGAVRILRDTHDIDFKLLYAGRICTDELARVRRIARRDCLRFPYFLKDVVSYKRILSDIAVLNGLTQNVKRPISCRSRVSSRNKNKKRKSPNKFRILSSPTRTKTLPMMPHPPLLRSRHSQFCKLDDNFWKNFELFVCNLVLICWNYYFTKIKE